MNPFTLGGKVFSSRLFIGTGKFASSTVMADAINQSGAQLVTVALRRVNLDRPTDTDELLTKLDSSRLTIVPNTSGARTAEEAVRIARIAREVGGFDWVKLELTPNLTHLLPDPVETYHAAKTLVADGFKVLPYINADPVLAKRLEDVGCVAVMPLGAPIGTNRGVRTREMIETIVANATVPVIVDAGLGMPSHAAQAIEMGASAVLVNTAIATADDPIKMACAFAKAVDAAELALDACPRAAQIQAEASSPLEGFLWNNTSL